LVRHGSYYTGAILYISYVYHVPVDLRPKPSSSLNMLLNELRKIMLEQFYTMAGENGKKSNSAFFLVFQGSVPRQRVCMRQVEGFGPK
jgi:hypothetical protein